MYFFLFISLAVLIFIVIFIANYKKNSHTELYREGVRNENDGRYIQALQNYEDALNEIRKLNLDNKFGAKISGRIKILRTFIDYENSFHANKPI